MYYAVIHTTRSGGKGMAVFPNKAAWEFAKTHPPHLKQKDEYFVELDHIEFLNDSCPESAADMEHRTLVTEQR